MKSTTITMANDDLQLVVKSLEIFTKSSISDNQKLEAERIIWILSQVLNQKDYEYSESALMNS
jgi:hypothetical protein